MGKAKKQPINTRGWPTTSDECGFGWEASVDDKPIRYAKDGETWDEPVPVPGRHYCVKVPDHVDDITNDDHRCCCGNTS